MRDRRQRTALFAAALAVSVGGALAGWRLLSDRSPPAPNERSLETADVAEAPPPSASAASQPSPVVDTARCAPEPPIDSGQQISGRVSRLLFGREEPWGTASVGTPTRGSLIGAVELGTGDGIELAGDYHWGTASVIRAIERAVREVRRCHPGSPDLYVGDISRENGGWLRPHRSHQAGLDADIGFYYSGPASWYERGTAKNLDIVRTWALWRALVDGGNVDMIFVDRSIQELVKAHLAKLPASEQPPEGFFEKSRMSPAVVRHAWGHATHFHVRFKDPEAVALGLALVDPADKGQNRVVRVQPTRPTKKWPPKKKR